MNLYSNKHLIIGAGPVGLAHAKAFKKAGLSYDQVDADDDVGGNWYHGTYQTAHIISSKKVTQYSDWPMPDDYPDFPSRQNMYDYYKAYANHFELYPNIEFCRKVVYVRPTDNNLWEVTFENGEIRIYEGVVICNGHHWQKRFPQYEGQFSGTWMHSKDYKHPDQLRDKRVLVIGGGNSACDVASEAARVGKSCSMSMRSGVWFFPKTFLGKPLTDLPLKHLPVWMQRMVIKLMLKFVVGDFEQYGLQKPTYKIFEKHPTISTEVMHYIKHGRIKPKPNVQEMKGNTVVFTDGTSQDFDTIVCATGYHVSYPFVPPELNRVEGAVVKTYAGSMLDDYKGIYFVGWAQPRGGVGSLVTPSSMLLARAIQLQQKTSVPMGMVYRNMGQKLPDTHIMWPQEIFKRLKRAKRFWWLVERKAQKMSTQNPHFNNPILAPLSAEQKEELLTEPMQVY